MIAVDTSPLVYAHRAGCPEHDAARRAIQAAADHVGGWGIPAACVFEFWSVVTYPSSVGGGSSPASARDFMEAMIDTAGAVILQISLTALEAGVNEIWTHDSGFVSLPGLVVRDPISST